MNDILHIDETTRPATVGWVSEAEQRAEGVLEENITSNLLRIEMPCGTVQGTWNAVYDYFMDVDAEIRRRAVG